MGASLGGKKRRGGAFNEINVTPLVDVMLVLLVVFMVTAPMLTTGIDIDLPKVEAPATPVKDTRLLLTVTEEGRVLLGKEDVSDRLDEVLSHSIRLKKEKQLFIQADKNARYGWVAEVVASAKRSGIECLSLMVQPEDGAPSTLTETIPAQP